MRTLERTRRAQDIIAEQRRTRLGLDLPEYNGDDATAWTEAERAEMETVHRTAGGFFRAGEVEMTSDNVRARIVADDDARRAATAAADATAAAERAAIALAATGRGRGRGRGGRGRGARGGAVRGASGRVSYKSATEVLVVLQWGLDKQVCKIKSGILQLPYLGTMRSDLHDPSGGTSSFIVLMKLGVKTGFAAYGKVE